MEPYPILRLMQLDVEVVNPELIEVTEDYVSRTIRHCVEPVFKRLLVMLLHLLASALHFKYKPGAPQ
jgi:hypothetical protein